ncbi:hypothetical protein NBRC110019_10340 [Neptunitalea chrysea]|uniref:Barstar (barnase inhibitor) domain-containing protein n=1 Tax=Neptunitalea chrysea TaxID=1647581 RepID=A0A9W6ETH7_9FLAO|nr:barstar family protein [Neptunitalea chrysea]GLB51995.1 hypothetical protein NBRC110019_10340 [Neptunitalea chrysea]
MNYQGIVLFNNVDHFDKAINNYEDNDAKIIEFDIEEISNSQQLHFELKSRLYLPSYYNNTFESLLECMLEYEIDEDGLVLIFEQMDKLPFKNLYSLLDVFATVAKAKQEEGLKFVVLAQVDNAYFKLYKPLNTPDFICWNEKEKK